MVTTASLKDRAELNGLSAIEQEAIDKGAGVHVAEYIAHRKLYQHQGLSLVDFVESRMRDGGELQHSFAGGVTAAIPAVLKSALQKIADRMPTG